MKSYRNLTLIVCAVVASIGSTAFAQDAGVTKEMLARAFGDDKFTEHDADRDGALTLKEFNAGADKKNIEIRTAMFRRADLNGDGTVKPGEAKKAVADFDRPPAPAPADAGDAVAKEHVARAFEKERFGERDANSDGELTLKEFNADASKENIAARTAIFHRTDLDSNGRVTRAEARRAVDEWDATEAARKPAPSPDAAGRKLDNQASRDIDELERKRRREIGEVNEEYVRELRKAMDESGREADPDRFEARRVELDAKRREKIEQLQRGYDDKRADILDKSDERAGKPGRRGGDENRPDRRDRRNDDD